MFGYVIYTTYIKYIKTEAQQRLLRFLLLMLQYHVYFMHIKDVGIITSNRLSIRFNIYSADCLYIWQAGTRPQLSGASRHAVWSWLLQQGAVWRRTPIVFSTSASRGQHRLECTVQVIFTCVSVITAMCFVYRCTVASANTGGFVKPDWIVSRCWP